MYTGFCWGSLGRPRRRWEDNIKMDLQEVGCGGMEWIYLAQDWATHRTTICNYDLPFVLAVLLQ